MQVNKYNTWASEGRWQAASHRALDKLAQVKAMVTTTAKCNVRGCGIPGCQGAGTRERSSPENLSILDPETYIKSALVIDNFNQKNATNSMR